MLASLPEVRACASDGVRLGRRDADGAPECGNVNRTPRNTHSSRAIAFDQAPQTARLRRRASDGGRPCLSAVIAGSPLGGSAPGAVGAAATRRGGASCAAAVEPAAYNGNPPVRTGTKPGFRAPLPAGISRVAVLAGRFSARWGGDTRPEQRRMRKGVHTLSEEIVSVERVFAVQWENRG
jgi:hypothetical protein